MKISLYLEGYHFLGGMMYKNIGTGLLTSYHNQKKILDYLKIDYVERWDSTRDILQINTPWPISLWIIWQARAKRMPVIIWAHVTAEDMKGVFRFGAAISPILRVYYKYVYGLADRVFCPSVYTKSLLVAYGLPAEKLVVQSNGVDAEKYIAIPHVTRSLVVGTVGLAIPRKGIDTFLKLAPQFPDHPFMWYGKIYGKLMVKALPKDLPANVKFTGFVDDIVAAYNAIDVFVFLSYEENQGMAILEAASVGLPILVRDIPVYQGWLVNEKNCLKAKTDQEFTAYLKRLLTDADLRTRLGAAARELAQQEDIKVLSQKTLGVYQELLATKKA